MKARNLILNICLVIYSINLSLFAQNDSIKFQQREWELFPIFNYDTDVGFGYGAKGFFYNFFDKNESFDLTAYNSTKGERWYRVVFSIPDIQRRQGEKYGSAIDIIIDYDKWINYLHYFDSELKNGINNKNYEAYVREPIEINAIYSRAFKRSLIAELGIKYQSINCYKFDHDGLLQYKKPSSVQHISILFNFRFDTRTNFINPKKGILLQLSNEYAKDVLGQKQNFYKVGLTFQSYLQMYYPELVLASRIKLQTVTETSYQNLLSIGGNRSVRGLPQDRYLANSHILINEELRLPIWWRFSGIVGIDISNSKSTPNWIFNPVAGLRFNMDNFIVRADLGFGKESTGFYFNFGHLF